MARGGAGILDGRRKARRAVTAALEAAPPGPLEPEVAAAATIGPLVTAGFAPGAASAIADAGTVVHAGYGRAQEGSEAPPDEDTPFQIGSVTKVFTGLLLAVLADRGDLALEDRLGDTIPRLPPEVARITLLDLATHHSGLPRLPPAFKRAALRRPGGPYAQITERDLIHGLREVELGPTRFRYSNFGYGVLGLALTRAGGLPFDELVAELVCGPLGLTDTAPARDPARAAQGHDARGRVRPPWDMAALAPAGGLWSTARDLGRLAAALTDPRPRLLGRELATATHARRPGDRPGQGVALAWLTQPLPGGAALWHNGGTGGFGAFLAVHRGRGTGVAVLTNAAHRPELDRAGFALLERIGPPPGRAPRTR
jgi:D-alanyl-D-alanine-carboxypeptidase/D-alanyl-D-alanine-endopeptidase